MKKMENGDLLQVSEGIWRRADLVKGGLLNTAVVSGYTPPLTNNPREFQQLLSLVI